MKRFFNAIKKGSVVGDGTVGDLVDWLEKYVNILFPGNGIEYWGDNKHGGKNALKRFMELPTAGGKDDSLHHVACYVRQGNCEGMIIEVCVYLRNDTMKNIVWAKAFGNEDECWMIARAVDSALNSIFFYDDIPELVDMAEKLPRADWWHRETSLKEDVVISTTADTLLVFTQNGQVFDDRNWSDRGANAHFFVEARAKDWQMVLTNKKASFRLESGVRHLRAKDLPGYVISDRGVEGITGYYVLPPGGNPLDDRMYLGYFNDAEQALAAARTHRESVLSELFAAA